MVAIRNGVLYYDASLRELTMRFCKLVIIGIVCNVLCSSNEPNSKRQCFSQINFTDFDFQRVAKIVHEIKDNSEFDATRYVYYTSEEKENGKAVFVSVGNVFTALWNDINEVCITQGPSDRWNSIAHLYSSNNDRQGKNRIFGHSKGHFSVRDYTPLIDDADRMKGLNEGWKIFENLFCDYIAFRGETLKDILSYGKDDFMKPSKAQFSGSQSVHFLDTDNPMEARLVDVKLQYSDYKNVTYAEIYKTFNDAINYVTGDRQRCFDMIKKCEKSDDIHYFKEIEIQSIGTDLLNDRTFDNSQLGITNAYCRAIKNMLWYFDELGCLRDGKEELLKGPFYNKEQPYLVHWKTADGRKLLYKTEGAEYSKQAFSIYSSYKKANMNLFELAQLLVKVIEAKKDHLNDCYSELVYLSIENIITGGGCYRGYVNRLMESILLAHNQ